MRSVAVTVTACAFVILGAAALASGSPTAPSASFVRSCETSVWGDLGDDWSYAVRAGPIVFFNARGYASAPASPSAGGGRYRGLKVLVLVRTGWAVRLVVAEGQRHRVALAYDRAEFGRPVVPASGYHDVTFVACPPGRPFLGPADEAWTQFNGSIVVAGRRCVRLGVHAAKLGRPLPEQPRWTRLSFGAGRCT